jgi:5-methylcytosine-specific restriction endonuclease McrA
LKTYFKKKKVKLKGAAWKKRRLECFTRDNFIDQYTGLLCTAPHPHHRVFKSAGGDDKLINLATCNWDTHSNHAVLKNKKLKHEKDDTVINELIKLFRV